MKEQSVSGPGQLQAYVIKMTLTAKLDKSKITLKRPFMAYGMRISAEKTKLMTNTYGISTNIATRKKKLKTIRSFKYLGAIVSDEGSKPKVLFRIAHTTAAVTKLKVVWNDKNIAISSKIRLVCSLTMSIFLYACERWTLTLPVRRLKTHTPYIVGAHTPMVSL